MSTRLRCSVDEPVEPTESSRPTCSTAPSGRRLPSREVDDAAIRDDDGETDGVKIVLRDDVANLGSEGRRRRRRRRLRAATSSCLAACAIKAENGVVKQAEAMRRNRSGP